MDKALPVSHFFTRNIGTLTENQQQTLQTAGIAVIGCGGLGGYVVEELARTGIGRLTLCDPDSFTDSNINRQLYALQATIGVNKALAAKERVEAIHGMTSVQCFPVCFQQASADLFSQADVVIDCLDNTAGRFELADLCFTKKIPLVHGAVTGWYGQVGVQTVGSTLVKELYPASKNVSETPISVIACTVAFVASLQVAEAIKLLIGSSSPLHNNWLNIDLKRMTFEII